MELMLAEGSSCNVMRENDSKDTSLVKPITKSDFHRFPSLNDTVVVNRTRKMLLNAVKRAT